MKSYAPARIAAIAVSRLPNAVIHRHIGPARHDALAEREGGLRGGLPAHLVAARAEAGGDRLAHLALVVDDEDAPAHDAASAGSAGGGRKIENRLPFPTSLSTSIQPPCSATIPCATARPSPVPSPIALVVKNGSNTRARSSRAMPRPSSSTVTQT